MNNFDSIFINNNACMLSTCNDSSLAVIPINYRASIEKNQLCLQAEIESYSQVIDNLLNNPICAVSIFTMNRQLMGVVGYGEVSISSTNFNTPQVSNANRNNIYYLRIKINRYESYICN